MYKLFCSTTLSYINDGHREASTSVEQQSLKWETSPNDGLSRIRALSPICSIFNCPFCLMSAFARCSNYYNLLSESKLFLSLGPSTSFIKLSDLVIYFPEIHRMKLAGHLPYELPLQEKIYPFGRSMAAVVSSMDQAELRRQIVAIQTNTSLSDTEKAQKRQALLSGSWQPVVDKQKEGSHLCWIQASCNSYSSLRINSILSRIGINSFLMLQIR